MLFILENIFTILFPYLLGMILMALVGVTGLWYKGYFEPPPPPITLHEQHQAETISSLGLDPKSPVVLGGSIAIFILSVLYIKLP